MIQTNLIGKNILGYTVTEKLGSGAFGTVYKVIKSNAAGQYIRALKHITIPTERQYNSVLNSMGGDISKADNYFSQMLNNIVSEIKILNDLSEKGVEHIVRYYENDIIVTDSPRRYDIYILMEYLTPLENFIQNSDFFVRDVIKLGLDVLDGIQSCHSNGVIHRDIKDDNIFVTNKGEYKIGDFGVSKVLKDSSKAESLKGTPNFLAPEVYLGKESYTKSVDLYSLGILLYRLLNYNRNPFLPRFPEQYFAQDEDDAFEKRMSGAIPDLPALGGEKIGHVIIKAISNSFERFQTANEFIGALELAIKNTPSEILDEKIKIGISSYTELTFEQDVKEYGDTIGENNHANVTRKTIEDKKNNSINKHLFDSVGESSIEVESVTGSEYHDKYDNMLDISSYNFSTNEEIKNEGFDTVKNQNIFFVLDKRLKKKLIYFIPFIILLIGVIAYFILIPNIYGKIVSFVDWLFIDSQSIINTLRNPNTVLSKINYIIGLKIFWWVWLVAFITSLFFTGKQLQCKSENNAPNAILTKKEPYLMIQEVSEILKHLKVSRNTSQFDLLIKSVKKLEEKLSIESDFGYGNNFVIDCENNIAKQIKILLDTARNIDNGDFNENLKTMNIAVMDIDSLLRRRIELKKR